MLLSRGAGLSRPSSVCNSATQVRTTHVVTHRLKSAGLALRQTPQYQLLDTIGVGSGTCVPVTTPHSHVALLQQLYDAADELFMSRGGYIIPAREQRLIEATGGSPTYGELAPEGIDAMMSVILPTAEPGSVFCDLGSGIGRVVIQAALSCARSTMFSQLVGVELSLSRLEQSEVVLQAMMEQLGDNPDATEALSRVSFVEEDATCTSWLDKATHVFMCSTAYGATACRRIVERLHASPSFQVLLASRELPFQPHLRKLGQFRCATSWNPSGTLCVYVRRDYRGAPRALMQRFLSREGVSWLPSDQPHLTVAVQEPVGGWKWTKSGIVLAQRPY